MIGPKDSDIEFEDELTEDFISVDKWGNEWDSSGDFSDIDFRLVDDDY